MRGQKLKLKELNENYLLLCFSGLRKRHSIDLPCKNLVSVFHYHLTMRKPSLRGNKILLIYKWQDRSLLTKPCDVQKHDSGPLQLLLRGGHCRGGWGAVPSWATQPGLPWPLSLLHLGQTVVPGSTKATPMRAPRFSVCLQRRSYTLVEFSQNPVPCRAQGRQRLMVLAHWGAVCPLAALRPYHKSIVPSLPAALWPVTKSWPQGTVLGAP